MPARRSPARSSAPPANPILMGIGQRARHLRERHGMTRRSLAQAANVSERYLANLEYGEGNPSILVLSQLAAALECPLAELLGDVTTATPEWVLLRSLLADQDEATLSRVRKQVASVLGDSDQQTTPAPLIALVGLRGAGKSTLGALLARALSYPFVELSRAIEMLAGCSVGEIQNLYGEKGYRRYERQALAAAIDEHPRAVIAAPGGLVSDPTTFNLLLSQTTTIWLQATPQDHMQRVIDQGDMRPIAASREAAADLLAILKSRSPYYRKADFTVNTSNASKHSVVQKILAHLNVTAGADGVQA